LQLESNKYIQKLQRRFECSTNVWEIDYLLYQSFYFNYELVLVILYLIKINTGVKMRNLKIFLFIIISIVFSTTMNAQFDQLKNMGKKIQDNTKLGLIESVTSQLGVTKNQAVGGVGSILNLVKGKLSASDFLKVANAIPGSNDLITSAIGLTGSKGTIGTVAALIPLFTKLGMKSDMVNKFIPVVLSYVGASGGNSTMNLLSAVLK
jgi:hypothetical protein